MFLPGRGVGRLQGLPTSLSVPRLGQPPGPRQYGCRLGHASHLGYSGFSVRLFDAPRGVAVRARLYGWAGREKSAGPRIEARRHIRIETA